MKTRARNFMRTLFALAGASLIFFALFGYAQTSSSDEAGRVLGLENTWNHAIEAKDSKALDMILASTFVAVDIDGSVTISRQH